MKILLLIFLLVGCTKNGEVQRFQFYCSYESQEKRVAFVQQCIKDANPMSDEEPEDMISACGRAAENLYCIWSDQYEAKEHFKRRNETLQEE